MQKSLLRGVTIILVSLFGVSCIIMPANGALTWTIETVDKDAGVGCSITLDDFGNPWISYDGSDGQLRVAHFTGTTWEKSIVDTTGDRITTISTNKAGKPIIAYQDGSNGRLECAELSTTWQIETVDAECQMVNGLSLVIDSTGNPHIAYIDCSDMDSTKLKYASRAGSTWSVEVVRAYFFAGEETAALQLDSANNPCISYYNTTSGALLFIHKVGSSWLPEVVDLTGGHEPSLKLRSDGQPGITYYKEAPKGYQLYYAHRESGVWHTQLVDSDGSIGSYSSLAFDHSDYPRVSYYDLVNKGLKYAYYDGTTWHIEAVDFTDNVGKYSSLVLDNWDNPYISYFNDLKTSLKYAYVVVTAKLPSVTPESDGVGVLLVSVLAAVGCYMVIKRKTT